VCLQQSERAEEGGGHGGEENKKPSEAVTVISYDEKPAFKRLQRPPPDLPPEPGVHPTFTREFEYKRHGTVSLLAGIDLVTGKVHALVKDRHRSREFHRLSQAGRRRLSDRTPRSA